MDFPQKDRKGLSELAIKNNGRMPFVGNRIMDRSVKFNTWTLYFFTSLITCQRCHGDCFLNHRFLLRFFINTKTHGEKPSKC